MTVQFQMVLAAASAVRNVGLVISALAVLAVIVYALVNIRSGRDEIGSEIELAPNRKPYFSDEDLEGKKLNWALMSGLGMLVIVALGLPLYWLGEPSRMDGAIEMFDDTFAHRGEALFAPTGEGGFNCAYCHGPEGVGGVAPYTITDEDGEFVANVQWKGPALNTVLLRHDEEEVMDALIYGRPYSPMPPWGEDGGGPLTSQQLEELIAYLWTVQLTPEEAQAEVESALRSQLGLGEDDDIDYGDPEVGEALFNLGQADAFAGGAYSCARCHTRGWSIMEPFEPEDPDGIEDYVGWPDGAGAIGPNLRDPLIPRQFGDTQQLIDFITGGSEFGVQYGRNGMGSGRMPAFGESVDPETDEEREGMLSEDMLAAIVDYVESLAGENGDDDGEED